MVECSLGGHLSELCPTTPTANQDGPIVWAQLAQQFQRRQFLSDFLPNFLFLVTTAILVGGGIIGHNSERGPPKDHSTKVWFKLALWF
jgi:hypothetical protein